LICIVRQKCGGIVDRVVVFANRGTDALVDAAKHLGLQVAGPCLTTVFGDRPSNLPQMPCADAADMGTGRRGSGVIGMQLIWGQAVGDLV
jgi:hypothetical protein